jgi:hypothetical protein
VTATQLRDCLQPVLPMGVLLVSDGAAAYRRFAADSGIMHEAVNVHNVNGWHSRFETWLVRFKNAQPTRTQPKKCTASRPCKCPRPGREGSTSRCQNRRFMPAM